MEVEEHQNETAVLSETDINFYGNPDVQFHFNSGREWESETVEEEQEDGTTVTKHTIDTTPCPTVDVYDMGDALEVLVHLPMHDPIIIARLRMTGDHEEALTMLVESLDDDYEGIDEVTTFDVATGAEDLGSTVQKALQNETPDSVPIPTPA